ncbi:MAG: allantoate amidohydrolase [Bauldia sp.]
MNATIERERLGERLMRRLDELAAFSDEPGKITRLYLSRAHRAAADQLMRWMEEAGLSARIDAVGNVIGRLEGPAPRAPALLIGSHVDSVRDAGRYDGPLGILAGIAAVEELQRHRAALPFAIEMIAFGDEEGVRFPTTLIGSRAMAGTLDPAALDAADGDGVSVAEALRRFGSDPSALATAAIDPRQALAYVEVHIEQGPVLERLGMPLGVVTAISGASRFNINVAGSAGHAGTTPMGLRGDALAGAAEMILAAERIAAGTPDLVATVGSLEVPNGAANVIPGHVRFSLDIRSPSDAIRLDAIVRLREAFASIAERRGLRLDLHRYHSAGAVPCDPVLAEGIGRAIAAVGHPDAPRLPSGAGHDGMAMAGLCPIAMMFVRCAGGVSHNPAESILTEDAALAVRALVEFILSFRPADFTAKS